MSEDQNRQEFTKMFSVSQKMCDLSKEYRLKRQTQSFQSNILNQVLAAPVKRTSEMVAEEQALFAKSTNVPLEFLYQPPQTSYYRPFDPSLTSATQVMSSSVGPQSIPEQNNLMSDHHSLKSDLKAPQVTVEHKPSPIRAIQSDSSHKRQALTTNSVTIQENAEANFAWNAANQTLANNAPDQMAAVDAKPVQKQTYPVRTGPARVHGNRQMPRVSAGSIVDENQQRDRSWFSERSSIGNQTYAAIRSEFEELIVERPPEIGQNHLAKTKYEHFNQQAQRFFIYFHLQNAIMDAKEEIIQSLRDDPIGLNPMVVEKIQSCYFARLRESELGSSALDLEVSSELVIRQAHLMAKLGWHCSGFFELLDKHFPTT